MNKRTWVQVYFELEQCCERFLIAELVADSDPIIRRFCLSLGYDSPTFRLRKVDKVVSGSFRAVILLLKVLI